MRRRLAVLLAALVLVLTGCGNAAATYTQYVQAVMDCTYYGRTEDYILLTGVSEADAQALHETEVQHMTELICHHMSVRQELLSEQTAEGYRALSETLLDKVHFSVQSAVRSEGAYQISVTCEPVDFWEISIGDVEQLYADSFSERFARAEDNELRLARLEAEWSRGVLDILNGYAEQTACKESVSTIIPITVNADGRYTVSEASWNYLDCLLLGIR